MPSPGDADGRPIIAAERKMNLGRPFKTGMAETGGSKEGQDISNARKRIETALQNAIIEWLPDRQSRAGLQISLIGLHSDDEYLLKP